MMGRFTSAFAVALLLGSAAVLALAVRNLLAVLPPGIGTRAGLSVAYHASGILTNAAIAFALFVFGVGLLRSARHRRVSRLVVGALGLIVAILIGIRAGYIVF